MSGGDGSDDSDVEEDMFSKCMALSEDAATLIEVAAPERPELRIPPVANCDGKGWGPKAFSSEQSELVASRNFLKAILDEDWVRVNALLAYRINLEFCDERGMRALHLAIIKRHKELVRFLLGQGVDVTCTTDDGQTALHFACAHNDLHLAVVLLHLHKLNGEDHDKSIHRTTKDNGDNALHLAALHGNVRIGKRLISAGIDFTCKNKQGQTPLMIAQMYEHPEFAALVERHIALEKERNEAAQKADDVFRDYAFNNCASYYGSSYGCYGADDGVVDPMPFSATKYTQLTLDKFAQPKKRRRHIRFVDGDDGTREQEMEADLARLRDNEEKFWSSKTEGDNVDEEQWEDLLADPADPFVWNDDKGNENEEFVEFADSSNSDECPLLIDTSVKKDDDRFAKDA